MHLKMSTHHHHHNPPLPTQFNPPKPPKSSTRPILTKPEPKPIYTSVESFAPATVANLGPAFDFLGCAISALGDHVTATLDPNTRPGRISISHITTAHKKISKNPNWNCAGISAISVFKKLKIRSVGVSISINAGVPVRSGLGSSAASAAAAAFAVNSMFGNELSNLELVKSALEAEGKLSGYHADNVAPAIMGGFVLIRSYDPLELVSLRFPRGEKDLFFVLVSPEIELQTKRMREVVPREVGFDDHVWNCGQAAALVAGVLSGDVVGVGKAMMGDRIVEVRRGRLIPGMEAVRRAAMEGGAFGCTISGSGPTVVAVTDGEERGRVIGERMVEAFWVSGGLRAVARVRELDTVGARVVSAH